MAHIPTFEFPIKDLRGVTQIHIIPPSSLPNFHGLENEDLDTFLFELGNSIVQRVLQSVG